MIGKNSNIKILQVFFLWCKLCFIVKALLTTYEHPYYHLALIVH